MSYQLDALARPLEELVAVARAGSVTVAAQELGVPQPTLSRSLARTAALVGTPLLARSGRGVVLTRHGRLLADAAAAAVEGVAATLRQVRAETHPDNGSVRLGFQHLMGHEIVPAVCGRVHAGHPALVVHLHQGGGDNLVADLVDGRLDLVLVSSPRASPRPGTHVRGLGVQRLVLLLPGRHPLAGRGSVRLRDVADQPFVSMVRGYGMRSITDALAREARLRLDSAYETKDLATTDGLVRAGLGVAVVPSGTASGGNVEVPLHDAADRAATRTVQLAWTDTSATSPPVRTVRDAVLDVVPALLREAAT